MYKLPTIVIQFNNEIESQAPFYLPELAHRTYQYAVNGKQMEKCLSIRNRLVK